jgi:acetyl-CoA synthetase
MAADRRSLVDIDTCSETATAFSWDALWRLFDGNRDAMNLAHECLDRHAARGTAVSVQFADGRREHYGFGELAGLTGQFAHWLARRGVGKGDRVAIVLDPGRAFYVSLFGAVKRGAIAVPLFTLFGPDGLALRVRDCTPSLILTEGAGDALRSQFPDTDVVSVDDAFWSALAREPDVFPTDTRASELAVFQYTSGTTRELPEAVRHTHRSVVTLMIAALYGVGLKPGDRYFCPSSPAWGHGLWHGTIAPLALGIHIGAYSGRFDPARILEALEALEITNMAAAATVFRMIRNAGIADRYRVRLEKISFTGEPMDPATESWVAQTFGTPACSMYGTTEVGVIVVNFPGFRDYRVRPGALGKPAPGWEVAVVDREGHEVPVGDSGEIAVRRKGVWFPVKDRGHRDAEGYLYHEGRSDDVIISAGWTMSAIEIEATLLRHPAVLEAAVIGVPDETRGQVVKAFIVARTADEGAGADIQAFMKAQLSQHEYPRQVAFVESLPKTPAGKINRRALRESFRTGA